MTNYCAGEKPVAASAVELDEVAALHQKSAPHALGHMNLNAYSGCIIMRLHSSIQPLHTPRDAAKLFTQAMNKLWTMEFWYPDTIL